jgi:glycosyltransferase involved in cell wall biosynthesis
MPSWFSDNGGHSVINDGMVPDAMAYQNDKAIMIVPLLSGGGLRVKILEAMALGKTVISTSIGAEGVFYTNGKDILIADTPDEFVRQILACKNSMEFCRNIGENAHRLIEEHYGLKETTGRMIRFYNSLI